MAAPEAGLLYEGAWLTCITYVQVQFLVHGASLSSGLDRGGGPRLSLVTRGLTGMGLACSVRG